MPIPGYTPASPALAQIPTPWTHPQAETSPPAQHPSRRRSSSFEPLQRHPLAPTEEDLQADEAAHHIHAIDEAARQEQILDEEEEALAQAWADDLIRRRREAAAATAATTAEQEQPHAVPNHVGGETQAQIESRVRREARAEWHRTDEYWVLDDTLGQAREQADRAAGVSGDVEWRSVSLSDEHDDDDDDVEDSESDGDGDGDGDGFTYGEDTPAYGTGDAAWEAEENARNGEGEESSG